MRRPPPTRVPAWAFLPTGSAAGTSAEMQEQPNDSSDSARAATKPGPAVSGLPAAPAYGRGSVAEVLGSAAASLGVPGFENVLGFPQAKRVCVVLADGLGRSLLKQKTAHTPFL